ncbi:MAG: hypothetical protein JNN04_02770 [Cyclobacteriaceae bacterium]|nr:hypothetical protein [Cyclobacteriaceae bacterium]
MNQDEFLRENKDFSIVLGGPFFQLLRKAHLTGNTLELVNRRVVAFAVLTWLPLLVFSAAEGQALSGHLRLPFLLDVDVHVRFLLALPLLVLAELVVHERLLMVIGQFQARKLIPDSSLDAFDAALKSSLRWRDSYFAEAFMVILIYVIGYQVVWQEAAGIEGATTWYYSSSDSGGHSLAGSWFRYVSLPVWQFLFLRWYTSNAF